MSFLTSFWALPQNEQVREAPSRFSMGIGRAPAYRGVGAGTSRPVNAHDDAASGDFWPPERAVAPGAPSFPVAADTYPERVESRSGPRVATCIAACPRRGRGIRAARGVRRLRDPAAARAGRDRPG